MYRTTDRLVLQVTPNLNVCLDDAGCIVLRSSSYEVTVSDADALKDALDLARVYRDHPEAAVHTHVYTTPDGYPETCRHLPLCSGTRDRLVDYKQTRSLEPVPVRDRLPGWPDPDARRTY